MQLIPVSNSPYVCLVDDEDFDTISEHSWCLLRGGGRNQRLYAQANIKIDDVWKRVSMHRFILKAVDHEQVDHKDNNGLNNQKANLRVATHSQNMHNAGPRGGSSRFKGVSKHKKAGKWLAQIMVNRRHHYLGVFAEEEDAARAYDTAAVELHGEFASLNFK